MRKARTLAPGTVRRLAVTKQRLAGPRPSPDRAGILDTVRDIGCLQIDPISAVARTQLLVLWSRLGGYDPAGLEALLWEERSLFEYWAHAASIVLTEEYPTHNWVMRCFCNPSQGGWSQRTQEWVAANAGLREHVLSAIREGGPLASNKIEDLSETEWRSGGWTNGRSVARMLNILWTQGVLMVAGRQGQQRIWDLAERCLPDWTPHEELDDHELTMRATERSLRILGAATQQQIKLNYTRHRYPRLTEVLRDFERDGTVEVVEIGDEGDKAWPGKWYVHRDDLPLVERIEAREWEPRTSLLSPFDNLIADRARTERLFDFNFRIEIYVPQHLRQYGYYVLPILQGDRLIGRIDPRMDRKSGRLTVNAVHAEPGAPRTAETVREIRCAIEALGAFLGAREITFGSAVPDGWEAIRT